MIHHSSRPGGELVLTGADATRADDPLLGEFLDFLVQDMTDHPERLHGVNASFLTGLQLLTFGAEVDLDSALSPNLE